MEQQTPMPSAIELMRQYSEAEMPRVRSEIEQEQQAQKAMFSLPQEFNGAPAVTICSVWPEPLDSQVFHHAGCGRTIYSIDAGSPKKPAYKTIQNTWDWTIVQEGQNKKGDRQSTISAPAVALDIIRHWTGDHPANRKGKKGIGIIKGFLATSQEIADLVKTQHAFLSYLVERADQLWDAGKREMVAGSFEYKKALRMLGLDISQHAWYRSKVQLFNDCPQCAEKIAVQAIFCKHCRNSIVDYFVDRSIIPDSNDWPNVAKEIERITGSVDSDAPSRRKK